MRSRGAIFAIWAVVFSCALSRPCFAQEPTDPSATKIIALENAWSRAIETKDLKALDGLLDAAFVYLDVDGRLMTKADVLNDIKESGIHQIITEAMRTHLHGDAAVVLGSFRMKGVKEGKPFLLRGHFVDTWVYRKGMWVCIASAGTLIAP